MTDFSMSIEINASPDAVWKVVKDVERWHEWTPTITSITRMSGGPFGVGSRVRIIQPKLLPATWMVTEFAEGRSFTWISRSPGLTATARHLIEPVGTGSRVTLSIHLSGLLASLVAKLARRLNVDYLQMEANGLKARCEKIEITV